MLRIGRVYPRMRSSFRGVSPVMHALVHAFRTLRRLPGFAGTALLTLAIGIGASTAMFAVVYGVLLKPLPYRDPARLVSIGGETYYAGTWELANYSAFDLATWQSRRSAFESVAASAGMSVALRARRTARRQ